jgi:hypothetical protein
MMSEYVLLKNRLNELYFNCDGLDKKQLRNINFYSISNFVNAYDKLKGSKEKETVYNLLNSYFDEMKGEDLNSFSKDQSKELFFSYIVKIGQYYNYQLGFKGYMGINGAIFGGIVMDLILSIFGILVKLYFIPISTILLVLFTTAINHYFGRVNKLYGYRY